MWIAALAAGGDGRPLWQLDAAVPLCLVLGAEGSGIRPLVARTCDLRFHIPMRGSAVGSLNVSVAAGIALARLATARRRLLGRPGDLPEEARVQLRDRFTLLAAKLARRMKPRP